MDRLENFQSHASEELETWKASDSIRDGHPASAGTASGRGHSKSPSRSTRSTVPVYYGVDRKMQEVYNERSSNSSRRIESLDGHPASKGIAFGRGRSRSRSRSTRSTVLTYYDCEDREAQSAENRRSSVPPSTASPSQVGSSSILTIASSEPSAASSGIVTSVDSNLSRPRSVRQSATPEKLETSGRLWASAEPATTHRSNAADELGDCQFHPWNNDQAPSRIEHPQSRGESQALTSSPPVRYGY
jgi:hypothetical protein